MYMINQKVKGFSEITQLSGGRSRIQNFVPSAPSCCYPVQYPHILTHHTGSRELMPCQPESFRVHQVTLGTAV